MQSDTVGGTFKRDSFSELSCQVNISKNEEDNWQLLSSANLNCNGKDCSAVSSMTLSSCSTYQFQMRCSTVVHLDLSTIQSLRSLLNPDLFNTANQVDSSDRLMLTSDWSPIYSRASPCLPSGTSPLYILLVVVIVLVVVVAILLYLWRFSERLQRLIKRFHFKLPNPIPPLEVNSREEESFISETPRPRPAPPLPRPPSSPSPPSEFVVGPLVDNSRTVYTPTKRNCSQESTDSGGYQPRPPAYVQLQSIRSRTTTTTSLASSDYVPMPDVLLAGQELEDCWEEAEEDEGEES